MNRALIACAALLVTVAVCGCSTDLGINDYQYGCGKDSDCGDGFACVTGRGCVSKGALDAGRADAGATPDAGGDAGGGADGGVAEDAGYDGSLEDAGADSGADAGGRDGGYILRFGSILDPSAGAGVSKTYSLKSVTGWSAGPKVSTREYQLKPGTPFKTTGKP